MMTMDTVLEGRTWRELRATSWAHGVPFNTHQTRAAAKSRLETTLMDEQRAKRSFRRLSADEREPLLALQAADGKLAAATFYAAFGPVRPYRPWRYDSPVQPWKVPASRAEKLWYLGFVTEDDDYIHASAEVLAMLPALPKVLPAAQPLPAGTAQPEQVLLDLALLLGGLLALDVRPIWDRWLPPKAMNAINARLRQSESLTDIRSELQAGRLRWLHYLAECAGLISLQGGLLKPTTQAWSWLALLPAQQWDILLAGIEQDLGQHQSNWERYRFPTFSQKAWQVLWATLRELPFGVPFDVISLLPAITCCTLMVRGDASMKSPRVYLPVLGNKSVVGQAQKASGSMNGQWSVGAIGIIPTTNSMPLWCAAIHMTPLMKRISAYSRLSIPLCKPLCRSSGGAGRLKNVSKLPNQSLVFTMTRYVLGKAGSAMRRLSCSRWSSLR